MTGGRDARPGVARRTGRTIAPMRPRIFTPALFVVLGFAPQARSAPPEPYDTAAPAITKALDAARSEERLAAYARLGKLVDARAIDLGLKGIEKERARAERVGKAVAENQAALLATLDEIEKLNRMPTPNGAAIEEFNRRVRKVEKRRDELYNRSRDLAFESTGSRAVLAAAVGALGAAIDALPGDVARPALERAKVAWTGPKTTPDDQVRWVDLLTAVSGHGTGTTLREVALDGERDVRVRVAALSSATARREAGVAQDAVALLAEGPTRWPVVAAAVDALRRLHVREGIGPLVTLLGREDLGRLREDVHRALRSLTAQAHGPYQDPWKRWWDDAQGEFTMPPAPADVAALSAPGKGVTFYGITTFSDRIVFVLDVSGSMLDPARAEGTTGAVTPPGATKIDVARRELHAALAMLDEKKTFECLLFGHRVLRLLGAMSPGTTAVVERVRKQSAATEPAGGTNIYEALETAFRAAGFVPGSTGATTLVADTIFFMTDGTPTAGRLREPAQILEAVADWNRTARFTIHVVAVGDECDREFLKKLALENGGQFVHR